MYKTEQEKQEKKFAYPLFLNEQVEFNQANTVVFVDYEAWRYALLNQYGMETQPDEWFRDLKEKGNIREVFFFADLTKHNMSKEIEKLRGVSTSIIDCRQNEQKKDFTDFIMLDQIYRKLIGDSRIEQFVLFTGDAHFRSVIGFLKNYQDKTVGVYCIKGSLSSQLKNDASWYVEMVPTEYALAQKQGIVDGEDPVAPGLLQYLEEIKAYFKRSEKSVQRRTFIPTFKNAQEEIVERNPLMDKEVLQKVLSDVITAGAITQRRLKSPLSGREIKGMQIHWEQFDQYLEDQM